MNGIFHKYREIRRSDFALIQMMSGIGPINKTIITPSKTSNASHENDFSSYVREL